MNDVLAPSLDITVLLTGFIDTLDRSALGRFVHDKKKLVIANNSFSHSVNEFMTRPTESGQYTYPLYSNGTKLYDLIAELWFWWESIDNIELLEQINAYKSFKLPIAVDNRIAELKIIASYPDYHDYFAVDVWDIELIAQCYADGVDASLARELVTS